MLRDVGGDAAVIHAHPGFDDDVRDARVLAWIIGEQPQRRAAVDLGDHQCRALLRIVELGQDLFGLVLMPEPQHRDTQLPCKA